MKSAFTLSPFGTARAAAAGSDQASAVGIGSLPSGPEIAFLEWVEQLREPLKTLYNMEDEIVYIAWELARWQEGLAPRERQALILLILSALIQLRQGSTRIALRSGGDGQSRRIELVKGLIGSVQPKAESETLVDAAQAIQLMDTLIESGRLGAIVGSLHDFKPLIVADGHLYLQKMLHLENRFADVMRRRLEAELFGFPEDQVERALADVLARPSVRNGHAIKLLDDQQAAVVAAVRHPVTIVSGGPGTGKTTIVISILRVLLRLGVSCEEIALAAPTGKAANRMSEAIRVGRQEVTDPAAEDLELVHLAEPRTLHRLLGYAPRTARFIHHENNRLAERVVVVDEGSMIDLSLMERLVRSLRDDCRFILLGDAHQLPSVEAGAVLRDLLIAGAATTKIGLRGVSLEHSYRMRDDNEDGRNILAVAQSIDRGEHPPFGPTKTSLEVMVERARVADISFHGIEFLASSEGSKVLDEFLDRWHNEVLRSLPDRSSLIEHDYIMVDGSFSPDDQVKLQCLFADWERFRILCLTRVLPFGADRLNLALHQRALAEREQGVNGDEDLIPGEPVMMQINDYNRGIFNGDQGLVLNVAEGNQLQPMAVFPRSEGFAAFHIDSMRPVLLHSYAMTVHKAQGSEFDRVALILPDRELPINTREILYTALTRSRTSVIIVGNREILENGISRKIFRDCGIAEKLGSYTRAT
jgi:exodeoxyribonuclease V alpha subunit